MEFRIKLPYCFRWSYISTFFTKEYKTMLYYNQQCHIFQAPYNTITYSWIDTTGNGRGQLYFAMDPISGQITVRQNLYQDTADTRFYTVS